MHLDKWDYRFADMARLVSTWSKDPNTKIGAIITRDKRILATGYNGFPEGIEDSSERLNIREVKYQYVIHGEVNALLNALNHGVSVRGANLYIYGMMPCNECAKLIIQAGIKNVFVYDHKLDKKWNDSVEHGKEMFEEAGVKLAIINVLMDENGDVL